MKTVHILHEGYSRQAGQVMDANCTCVLIKDNTSNKNHTVVDTMTAWDAEIIRQMLHKHDLQCEDIQYVVCTHGHSDHIGNNNLFVKAKYHIVGDSISNRSRYLLEDFPFHIDDDIQVVKTPGHTMDSVSVLIKTAGGLVAVVGDLFEREEDIRNPALWKEIAGSENPQLQEENRQKILNLANLIVPGHGPLFETKDYQS